MVNPLLGKKLKGEWEGSRSYRIASIRIIYEFSEADLDITSISDRKDVYR